MTDEEMMKKIDDVMLSFTGQFDDLSQIVGMIVLGRQYGWRVIRLVHSRRSWTLACKYFGDLKLILPKDGKPEYVRKSVHRYCTNKHKRVRPRRRLRRLTLSLCDFA